MNVFVMGDLVRVSEVLLRYLNVLIVLYSYFQAIKLNIKRPWDSDSVKLNLIEIYGKPALSLQRPTSAKRLSKRYVLFNPVTGILDRSRPFVLLT